MSTRLNSKSKLAQEFWGESGLKTCPILDFHGHRGELIQSYLPLKSADDMIKTMDKCNVVMLCFCGHRSLFTGLGNAEDVSAVNKYHDRFKMYYPVLSNYCDFDKDINLISENPQMYVGFKFLCDYYSVKLSDNVHAPYFEYADRHGLFILSHTWKGIYNGPDEAEKILEKYRNLVFIAGHSFHDDWDSAVRLANKYPNLYLELTAVVDDRGTIEKFVNEIGSNRILFGTDLPWFSTLCGVGAILSADITDEDRKNIFYRNGAKLMSRFSWFDAIWSKHNVFTL